VNCFILENGSTPVTVAWPDLKHEGFAPKLAPRLQLSLKNHKHCIGGIALM
jgi:hypothetical protein